MLPLKTDERIDLAQFQASRFISWENLVIISLPHRGTFAIVARCNALHFRGFPPGALTFQLLSICNALALSRP